MPKNKRDMMTNHLIIINLKPTKKDGLINLNFSPKMNLLLNMMSGLKKEDLTENELKILEEK